MKSRLQFFFCTKCSWKSWSWTILRELSLLFHLFTGLEMSLGLNYLFWLQYCALRCAMNLYFWFLISNLLSIGLNCYLELRFILVLLTQNCSKRSKINVPKLRFFLNNIVAWSYMQRILIMQRTVIFLTILTNIAILN